MAQPLRLLAVYLVVFSAPMPVNLQLPVIPSTGDLVPYLHLLLASPYKCSYTQIHIQMHTTYTCAWTHIHTHTHMLNLLKYYLYSLCFGVEVVTLWGVNKLPNFIIIVLFVKTFASNISLSRWIVPNILEWRPCFLINRPWESMKL